MIAESSAEGNAADFSDEMSHNSNAEKRRTGMDGTIIQALASVKFRLATLRWYHHPGRGTSSPSS